MSASARNPSAVARGVGIDHVLATRVVADRSVACTIDRNARKGQDASDHAPVIAEIADARAS